jgi:hypothetical protein
MGLTAQDVLDLNAGWRKTTAIAMRAVAKAGGWVWQMFSNLSPPPDTGPTCTTCYRNACAKLRTDMSRMNLRLKDPHAPGSVLDAATDVARFLLIRGTYVTHKNLHIMLFDFPLLLFCSGYLYQMVPSLVGSGSATIRYRLLGGSK